MAMTEDGHERAVAQEFLRWIKVARDIVDDHFPAERTEPHNLLVIETARSLMLADRLKRIETMLGGPGSARAQSKES